MSACKIYFFVITISQNTITPIIMMSDQRLENKITVAFSSNHNRSYAARQDEYNDGHRRAKSQTDR